MKTLRLTDCDFAAAAERLGTDVPSLRAVHEVETGSSNGFWAPGKPIILFEGHVFWKQLEQRGISPAPLAAGNESILYPRWTRRYYGTEREEYARLARALRIHEEAALMSASWGMFQIMGFNHKACGFASVHDFVRAMSQSPQAQLLAFVGFVEQRGLVPFLREHRWGDFARRYNGPGYVYNRYDLKLREAYERWGGRAGTMPLAAG
ncbi:MAG TPA: N-acetylmuramidase family protein [Candidatus Odoribacter faecigallinarum]|uniref:N-acetylmuramidase family protein n=1 Tax=Candidatus Odoribacter faecigallinarum TaxID=2838706 RepID=A0A9D1V151_9BACT|nr:N-acetylmuramidase family protein [Candidatus Odoribacter faecigallinarum]